MLLNDFCIIKLINHKKMNSKQLLLLLIISLSFFSCHDNRSKELDERETILAEKERQFSEKEAEYQALIILRDSLENLDNEKQISRWPVFLDGQWSSKTICTESNCSDYVIGDTRNDFWEFRQDSTKLWVDVSDKNNLIRSYDAQYLNDNIKMHFKSDSTASKMVEMNIELTDISEHRIKGLRTVTVNGNCQAKFNVELIKTTK